ncbi:hypothetical protein P355_4819 [Burkholderia cenocepacia KC-01]|nr:hypothetical protein P355_4819 [Burkholderia cenocepacia KC-01]
MSLDHRRRESCVSTKVGEDRPSTEKSAGCSRLARANRLRRDG